MAIENPSVREYLLKRKQERDALENQVKEDSSGINFGAALAALGAGFQGKDAVGAGQSVLDAQDKRNAQKIADFDKGTDSYLKDTEAMNAADALDREKAIRLAEDDVNSDQSKIATQLAQKMGFKGGPISASKFKEFSPSLQKMYEIEQRKLDRADSRQIQNDLRQQRLDEKKQGLETPFGMANTEQDAKVLKDAWESKSKLDDQIKELIGLREKFGGEYWNSDATARAKQLSNDILLNYKNLAKLGVLSQSDENIINEIVPKDPLQFSPMAALRGNDPILTKLKGFQSDTAKDFENRVATRTRAGIQSAAKPKKEIAKTQTNQITGEKRIVYTDGSTEIIPSKTAGM